MVNLQVSHPGEGDLGIGMGRQLLQRAFQDPCWGCSPSARRKTRVWILGRFSELDSVLVKGGLVVALNGGWVKSLD